jgi:hypothetical protein
MGWYIEGWNDPTAELWGTGPFLLGSGYDLSSLMPESVLRSSQAAEGYRLFFIFEEYLRDLVIDVLSKEDPGNWWNKVPEDIQSEVAKLEETEEAKRWMALGSRDNSSLMTYPQLLRVIDYCWKLGFDDLLRDRGLVQEARLINHLRNTLCHMTPISEEEMERIRQIVRDWFRVVAP